MGEASQLVLATVKWFGGHNNRTGRENAFGFAESITGDDIFIHKKITTSDLNENQLVVLDVEKGDKGYTAIQCFPKPTETHLEFLIDTLETKSDPIVTYRKDLMRGRIIESISIDIIITKPISEALALTEFLYSKVIEKSDHITPWKSSRHFSSDSDKVVGVFDALVSIDGLEEIKPVLMEAIISLPPDIIARLSCFDELILREDVNSLFKNYFADKDIDDSDVVEKLLKYCLSDNSKYFDSPKIIDEMVEKAAREDPELTTLNFVAMVKSHISTLDHADLKTFLEQYQDEFYHASNLDLIIPEERLSLSLLLDEDISIYPDSFLQSASKLIEDHVRSNIESSSIHKLLDHLSADAVIDLCFSRNVVYEGIANRQDVIDKLNTFIDDPESSEVPKSLTKYLAKLDVSNVAEIERYFSDPSTPEILKKMIGPKISLTLLFNKSILSEWMYERGYAGPRNMYTFVLFALLPLLIKNKSDIAFSVFKHRLWRYLEQTELNLDESLMKLFPSCGTLDELSCEAVYWPVHQFMLCRSRRCSHPKVLPNMKKSYARFTIYEWLKHYGIDYFQEERPQNSDFAIRLAGYFNRLKEIADVLYCRSCDKVLMPNFRYSRTEFLKLNLKTKEYEMVSMSAAYRVTVFRCENNQCEQHQEDIYINHCIGWNCNALIDSRDLSIKCSSGMYVCGACCACCQEHIKEYPPGICPKCGSRIDVWEKWDNRFIYCSNRNCDFQIKTDDMPKRFLLDSMPVRRPGEKQSNQGTHNTGGYSTRKTNSQSSGSSNGGYYDDDPGWGG